MKFTKLFMLALGAMFVASCSNDDDKVNNLETTVGFQKETLSIKENSGIVNIPITIEGYRNGNVSVEIVAEGTGANPAKEGVNFRITDTSLTLLAKNDTTNSAVLNVELQTIDDDEINEPREVTLTIKSADGAKIGKQKIVVTLRDNDSAFYEKFFGKWILKGVDHKGVAFEKLATITGAIDENDTKYNKVLTITVPGLFNVGVSLDCEWRLAYTYDKQTKTGTLSHVMLDDLVATYGSAYQWVFVTEDEEGYLDDSPVTTSWKLGENDAFPTEITWDEDQIIYLYQPGEGGGLWAYMTDLKLVRQ